MRVLLATGDDKLNDQIAGVFPKEWEEARCFYRAVLAAIAHEVRPDVVVLSTALDGPTPFAQLLEELWLYGYRVVLGPGEREVPATRALVREAVKYHVYDFVYNQVTGEKVVDRILHPAVPVQIEKELLEPAGELADKLVPEMRALAPVKKSFWPWIKKRKAVVPASGPAEALLVSAGPGTRNGKEGRFSRGEGLAPIPLSGLIAVVSPWMSKSDPAIAAVFCAEYLFGLGRKVALLDATREKVVRNYVAGPPREYGQSAAWLLGAGGDIGQAMRECEAVVMNVGECPEEVPADAEWKLLVLGRPAFVGGFSAKRWAEVGLPGFSLLVDQEDGPDIAQVLRLRAVRLGGYDVAYHRIGKWKPGA